MAKKKPAAESSELADAAKPQTRNPPAAKLPSLSHDLIGDTAGAVWHTLSTGPQTLAALKKSVDAPADATLAAVGWLAREGKVAFDSSGRSVTVSLR